MDRLSGSDFFFFFAVHEVGGGGGLRDLKASDVTPRTALLSWIPTNPTRSYRLTYQTEGHEVKVGKVADSTQ